MARHLEFDRTKVLEAAMKVFWLKGYQGTSMVDLETATGLKPGSIYNSFKSKKGLFVMVIAHYRKQTVEWRITHILNTGSPLQGIEAFFRTTYQGFKPDQLIGCMLTNTATELNTSDAEIEQGISQGLSSIQQAFHARLKEAQQNGEIENSVNIAHAALHLTSCYQGLCVIGRLTKDSAQLKIIADQALASISVQVK